MSEEGNRCGKMQSSLHMETFARVRGTAPLVSSRNDVQDLSDEELIRLCASEQDAAMRELVRRYQAPLHRFLARYLCSAEDAEQAVLNVFIRTWQSAARFQFRSRVSTWLYRIAANVAHDLHRSRGTRVREEPWKLLLEAAFHPAGNAEHEAFQSLDRQDTSLALHRALNQLNETDRLVLVLYYFEERTYEEIQEIAQLSYKVLKTRLTRARHRLRTLVESDSQKTDNKKKIL